MSPADCPPAFQDPTFELHKSFCEDEINPGLAKMYGTALEEVDLLVFINITTSMYGTALEELDFHLQQNILYFPLLIIQCSLWSRTLLSTDLNLNN